MHRSDLTRTRRVLHEVHADEALDLSFRIVPLDGLFFGLSIISIDTFSHTSGEPFFSDIVDGEITITLDEARLMDQRQR
jgi:hypothetical protein